MLENADHFDAPHCLIIRFRRKNPIDPQQRLFLQDAWHALEHTGYEPSAIPHKTSVFATSSISTYPRRKTINLTGVAQVKKLQSLMGNDKDYVTTRVAYKLNLQDSALSVYKPCPLQLVGLGASGL